VLIEVVDFGGTGRPLLLLAGLGDTAHVFTDFAPHLTAKYHVYGLTRRGFGKSSAPSSGYSAERLGDDVAAAIGQLGLKRTILVGHSFGGEELSSVGTHHPELVAGLIYLDAGYQYALQNQQHTPLTAKLSWVAKGASFLLPSGRWHTNLAIVAGQQSFTELHVPVLAIFADPHDLSEKFPGDTEGLAKAESRDHDQVELQATAFERQVPGAKVVRIPYASHLIFKSNEGAVVSEMDAFIGGLPKAS
jgi:pimeloyl-ACP methyl ester carboxylesterase